MEKILNIFNVNTMSKLVKKSYLKYKIANSSFWVTSLSFYTILALVPIIAILFSIGSWFGAKDYLLEQLNTFSPFKRDIINLLLGFSENLLNNARGGILAGFGFVFLGWTFIKMFSLIENAFNDIWQIKKPRSILRRVSDYISFFIFLPLIFILLNGISIFLTNKISAITLLYHVITKLVPFLSLGIFLLLLYLVMPNTKVKYIPAISSSILTSILFFIFQYLFAYIQHSINTYNIIYGSFSIIFIFLLWIRITWFLIILGVHLTYFLQNSNLELDSDKIISDISFNSKVYIYLRLIEELVNKYINNSNMANIEDFVNILNLSPNLIKIFLNDLEKGGYIVTGMGKNEEEIYCLTCNVDTTKLQELYDYCSNIGYRLNNFDDNILTKIEKIMLENDYDRTLRSLGDK